MIGFQRALLLVVTLGMARCSVSEALNETVPERASAPSKLLLRDVLLAAVKAQPICSSNPCQNRGVCYDLGALYQCSCRPGFTGLLCEYQLGCASTPCQNGGFCSYTFYGYRCYCRFGYIGPNCEMYNVCFLNPCQNGGMCFGDATAFCQCAPGYAGPTCEQVLNRCVYSACMNGGTCYDNGYSAACRCPPLFGGDLCHLPCALSRGEVCYLWS